MPPKRSRKKKVMDNKEFIGEVIHKLAEMPPRVVQKHNSMESDNYLG